MSELFCNRWIEADAIQALGGVMSAFASGRQPDGQDVMLGRHV